jgi:hypothetical protein
MQSKLKKICVPTNVRVEHEGCNPAMDHRMMLSILLFMLGCGGASPFGTSG